MKFQNILFVTALGAMINHAQAAIVVTNGTFESTVTTIPGNGQGNVNQWFDSDDTVDGDGNSADPAGYNSWHYGAGDAADNFEGEGTNSMLVLCPGTDQYAYQSLGTLDAGTPTLNWSFNTNNLVGDSILFTFYQGSFAGAADGVNITDIGAGQPTVIAGGAFTISGADTYSHTGSLDVSSLAAGTEIWVGFNETGAGFRRIDNVAINAVPEPSVTLLGSIAVLGLLRRRR